MTILQLEKFTRFLLKQQKKRYANFQNAQNSTKEVIIITDAYYREALDEQMKAQLDFMSKRASLEELVGNETFTEFEKLVNAQQN